MRRVVLALVLFFFSSFATAQQYVRIRTPEFTVISNAGESRARDVAERFEQVRAAFALFFNAKNPTIPAPLTIIAIDSTRDFQQILPRWIDAKLMPSGLWEPGEDQNLIIIDLAAESRKQQASIGGIDFGLVRFTKLLMAGNTPPLPVWYDDGFTEYCSSLKTNGKQLEYGVPRADVMKVLQSQPWLKLAQLFGNPPNSPDDIEAQRHTIYYAQSWITIHYLINANAGAQLNRFVDLMQHQKMDMAEAVRRAFSVEPASFDNAVRNYFEMHMADFRANIPADFAKASLDVRPLKPTEWTATLADIAAHSSTEHDKGLDLYKKVIASDPSNSIANRGLGYAYLQHSDFGTAEAYLSKAASSDAGDPIAQYLLALLANRKQRTLPQAAPPDIAQVRFHLRKAIALDPSYADAYQLLAWAESEDKNADAARAAIEQAVELNPRNESSGLAMAQAEIQAKNYGKARPLLERLEGSTQPEVSTFAHNALQSLGVNQQPASIATRENITAPQWRDPKADVNAPIQPVAHEDQPAPAPNSKSEKIAFLKGELVSVDCSKAPAVTVTFSSKGQQWTLTAPDAKKVLLIGEENFSCSWMDRKASVNFRQIGQGKGEIVSLEFD